MLTGAGAKIWNIDFHALTIEQQEKSLTAPMTIRRNAFVGAGAVILKGMEIGEKIGCNKNCSGK